MRRALTALTASTLGMGVVLAATSAKAFVPVVLAAIIAGSVLGGAALGTAANNAANNDVVAGARSPAVVAPGPGVTVGSTSCYFTHAWVGHVWQRVQVCNNY